MPRWSQGPDRNNSNYGAAQTMMEHRYGDSSSPEAAVAKPSRKRARKAAEAAHASHTSLGVPGGGMALTYVERLILVPVESPPVPAPESEGAAEVMMGHRYGSWDCPTCPYPRPRRGSSSRSD